MSRILSAIRLRRSAWLLASAIAVVIVVVAVVLLVIFMGSPKESESTPQPILRDQYSLYILDPGPFRVVGPETLSQKEFLVLQAGEVELSCGSYPGAIFAVNAPSSEIAAFASETIKSPNWLPGCHRWLLDASEVTIGDGWFYCTTLLVRRDPEWSRHLSELQRLVHRRELERLPDDVDRIVQVYYTVKEKDIYIFTLTGPPEDVAAAETDTRKLLAGVRLNAGDIAAQQNR